MEENSSSEDDKEDTATLTITLSEAASMFNQLLNCLKHQNEMSRAEVPLIKRLCNSAAKKRVSLVKQKNIIGFFNTSRSNKI